MQEDNIVFTHMAETFPSSMKWKDLGIMLAAIVLSGVSVIPNFYFGGKFGVEFVNSITNDDADHEKVRIFAALMSAIVNGYINANSVNNAIIEITHQGKKFSIPGERVKAFFGLLAFLSLAGIASIPNIQFVKDTIQGWTKAATVTMVVVVYFINCALNLRAIAGSWHAMQPHTFGKDNQRDASIVRWKLLLALNNALTPDKQLQAYEIKPLSEGVLYKDHYSPWVRRSANILAGLTPSDYSVGAYFFSAEDAMENFTAYNPQAQSVFNRSKFLLAVSVASIAMLLKWAFLGKANINATQQFSNAYLASPILKTADKFPVYSTLRLIFILLHLIIAALSLTGGMGMVQEYLFDDKNTLKNNLASIFITLLAAIGINFLDFLYGNIQLGLYLRRIWITATKNTHAINADKFGDNYQEFILNTMRNIAQMPDGAILSKYTTDITKQEKMHLLENGHANFEKFGIGENRETNATFAHFKQEIAQLSEDNYRNFLSTYNKPADKNELSRPLVVNGH